MQKVKPKTAEELRRMREAAQVLRSVQTALKSMIKAGVSLQELDTIAEDIILTANCIPAFKNFPGEKSPFPGTLCTMINSEIVHGIPDNRILRDGDLLSVDCGVIFKDYHADAAFSLVVGGGDKHPKREKFQQTVYEALQVGCKSAKHGARTGDIGYAIQTFIEKAGYRIVREYTGHGLGRELHEEPSIFNYGTPGKGMKLLSGMTLAIEPIITVGSPKNKTLKDGWTVVTVDGKDACQWEHCGVVTADGLDIFV
jgi:methionyl aminopeptidase